VSRASNKRSSSMLRPVFIHLALVRPGGAVRNTTPPQHEIVRRETGEHNGPSRLGSRIGSPAASASMTIRQGNQIATRKQLASLLPGSPLHSRQVSSPNKQKAAKPAKASLPATGCGVLVVHGDAVMLVSSGPTRSSVSPISIRQFHQPTAKRSSSGGTEPTSDGRNDPPAGRRRLASTRPDSPRLALDHRTYLVDGVPKRNLSDDPTVHGAVPSLSPILTLPVKWCDRILLCSYLQSQLLSAPQSSHLVHHRVRHDGNETSDVSKVHPRAGGIPWISGYQVSTAFSRTPSPPPKVPRRTAAEVLFALVFDRKYELK